MIQDFFRGRFLTPPDEIAAKLHDIKAYVWDWDGVFNNGFKMDGSSPFNEVDSMGTNLLRFHHYLLNDGVNPVAAIISGESNGAAHTFAKREHFQALYFGAKNKQDALTHLCDSLHIKPQEILFFFDDVLDFTVSKQAGLRIMIGRQSNPLMTDYAVRNGLADYITANDGGHCAIREGVELITGLSGKYDELLDHRIRYSDAYHHYITQRNAVETAFYKVAEGKII